MQTFETTEGLYYFFLDGIRKEYTNTVPPQVFNRLINEAQIIWFDGKIEQMDQDEEAMKAIAPVLVPEKAISTPYAVPSDCYRTKVIYVAFDKLPNGCSINNVRCRPYKHNVTYEENPYRKPGYKNPYYYQADGKYVFVTGDYSVSSAKLTYLRTPRKIYYDEVKPTDSVSITGFNKLPYNPGSGSVPPEFHVEQRREIVDTAVRLFLERRTDPRYQSMLQEQLIRRDN